VQYAEQLKFKQQIVEDAFRKIGKITMPSYPPVLGSASNFYYRNKLEFAFTNRKWLTNEEINSGQEFESRNGLGFHVPGKFSAGW
jgi:23S rRNA (uracil1939-C5)-methyltransferase